MALTTRERVYTLFLQNTPDGPLLLQFSILVLFVTSMSACNSTCFVFTSNPPNGTLHITASNPPPACRLAKANSTVRVHLATQPTCNSCVGSGQIQHIFLGIQSIALSSSPTAHDHSVDWQELLPTSAANEPFQVDLLRGAGDLSALKPLGEVTVPAGIYTQVRLRFSPNQRPKDVRVAEGNRCDVELLNCVVMGDGRAEPLVFENSLQELRITSNTMEDEIFLPLRTPIVISSSN